MLRIAAVIPAAGRARRFGSQENKIWANLGGFSVLQRTLTAFCTHPSIVHVIVVVGEGEAARVREIAALCGKAGMAPVDVAPGGETRAASVRNGLEALPDGIEVVLVHDAARPLVSHGLIDRVIEATLRTGAAVPGLPLSDTVKRVDHQNLVRATIPRSVTLEGVALTGLTAVQTPQGALVADLKRAYALYDFASSEPTDEASLVEAMGGAVEIALGDPHNIKITRQEDILLAERLLSAVSDPLPSESAVSAFTVDPASGASSEQEIDLAQPDHARGSTSRTPASDHFIETRTGFGYDVHAFAAPEAGRKLFLGGIEIPYDRGLEGHSDADVLLHAICDALLGAVSLGDIGILFPNTDEAYRGISSLRLLAIVAERVKEAGWQVINIDATLVAEAPKLMPHRVRIQQTISASLGLAADRVSVKATTSEKMGFVGRGEGIACWAVATVRRLSS